MRFQELSEIFASKLLAFLALWPEIQDDYEVVESFSLNDWNLLKMYSIQFKLTELTLYVENVLKKIAHQELDNLADIDDFPYLHFLLGFLDEKEKPSVINRMTELAESIEEKMIVFNLDPSEDNAQRVLDCVQSFEDAMFIMENDDTGSRFVNLRMIDEIQKWPKNTFAQIMDLYESAMILCHKNPVGLIKVDLEKLTDSCEEWLARFNEEKNSSNYFLAEIFFKQILKTAKNAQHLFKAYFYTRAYRIHAQTEATLKIAQAMHDEIQLLLQQWLRNNPDKIKETLNVETHHGTSHVDDLFKQWMIQEIQKIAKEGVIDPADQAVAVLKGFADQA